MRGIKSRLVGDKAPEVEVKFYFVSVCCFLVVNLVTIYCDIDFETARLSSYELDWLDARGIFLKRKLSKKNWGFVFVCFCYVYDYDYD